MDYIQITAFVRRKGCERRMESGPNTTFAEGVLERVRGIRIALDYLEHDHAFFGAIPVLPKDQSFFFNGS